MWYRRKTIKAVDLDIIGVIMIVSAKRILELSESYNLIENLSERERTNPEGVGFDLRVGEVYRLSGEAFLGVTERKGPAEEMVASISRGDKEVVIKPGEYVLLKTMEKFNLPADKIKVDDNSEPALLMLRAHPRSTLHRFGQLLLYSKTDPGYSGELVFALSNVSNIPLRLELGARFANITFEQVTGDLARAYSGQWKGGRVATGSKETQN
jgi:deoxycytidine triphosphate deaminase